MAELFVKDSDTLSLHFKNIQRDEELDESSTTENSSVVQDRTYTMNKFGSIHGTITTLP